MRSYLDMTVKLLVDFIQIVGCHLESHQTIGKQVHRNGQNIDLITKKRYLANDILVSMIRYQHVFGLGYDTDDFLQLDVFLLVLGLNVQVHTINKNLELSAVIIEHFVVC